MKVYGVFYYDTDDCTYGCDVILSIWSDEYKALTALQALDPGVYAKDYLFIEEITVDSAIAEESFRRIYP